MAGFGRRRVGRIGLMFTVLGALALPTLAVGASPSASLSATDSSAHGVVVERHGLPGRSLRVRVVQPPNKKARVVVSGPRGFRRTLRNSDTLRKLAPGKYRISAETARTRKWIAEPVVSDRTVRVRTKRGTQVDVSYFDVVSTKVEVMRSNDIEAFAAPGVRVGVLTTDEVLKHGDIAAAGVSARTPMGMLVRVTKVRAGGRYEVVQARLDEAFPRGDFDTVIHADASDSVTGRGLADPSLRGILECSAGAAIQPPMVLPRGGMDMGLSGSWDSSGASMTVTITPYVEAELSAALAAGAGCVTERTLLDRYLKPIIFSIGPVPVVIVPRFRLIGSIGATAEGELSVQAKAGLHATVRGTASRSGLATSYTGPNVTRSASLQLSASAAAELALTAKLTGDFYGLAGPYASAKVGVRAIADVAANPWWRTEAFAQAGLGVELEKCKKVMHVDWCLKLSAGKDDIIAGKLPISDAGGPKASPTVGPSSTPSLTPTPSPTGPTTTTGQITLVAPDGYGGSFSGDGGSLAYALNTGASMRLWDRTAGTTSVLGEGLNPLISLDARHVAFQGGDGTAPGDTNGATDVFLLDRGTGAVTRVSDNARGSSWYVPQAISADGRHVAYASMESNLVPADTNDLEDVFVWDRATGITTRITNAPDGTESNGPTLRLAMSADGNYVAYASDADNLVAGDMNGVADIFVWDRHAGSTTRITDNTSHTNLPLSLAVSGDGRYVTYESPTATSGTHSPTEVVVWDRLSGTKTRVSAAPDGTPGNASSSRPSISTDGRYIAYESYASNLVPSDTNDTPDVFVWDRDSGTTARISLTAEGGQRTQNSGEPSMSPDGRLVAFLSIGLDSSSELLLWARPE